MKSESSTDAGAAGLENKSNSSSQAGKRKAEDEIEQEVSLKKQRREDVSLYDDVSEEPKVGEFIVTYPSSESPIFHKCSWRRDSQNDSDGVPRFPPLVIPKDVGADQNSQSSVTGLTPIPLNITVGYAVPLIADAHERETRKRVPGYDEVEYRDMMRSFLMSED